MINRAKIRIRLERKEHQAIHNERMNGTLIEVIEYCDSGVVSNKEELKILMQNVSMLSQLSLLQLTTLKGRLGEIGCEAEEILKYGKIINNCVKIIEQRVAERKHFTKKNKTALKGFRKSNLFKVKTPSEKRAAKFKQPFAHILYNRNGGK